MRAKPVNVSARWRRRSPLHAPGLREPGIGTMRGPWAGSHNERFPARRSAGTMSPISGPATHHGRWLLEQLRSLSPAVHKIQYEQRTAAPMLLEN
jgi:hypothetical protein